MSDAKAQLQSLFAENEKLKCRVNKRDEENESLKFSVNERDQEIEGLRERIQDLLRRLYGRKSERFEDPNQTSLLELLNWAEEQVSKEEKAPERESISYTRKRP